MAYSFHKIKPFCKVGRGGIVSGEEQSPPRKSPPRPRKGVWTLQAGYLLVIFALAQSLGGVTSLIFINLRTKNNNQLAIITYSPFGRSREISNVSVCHTEKHKSLSLGSATACHRKCRTSMPLPQLPWPPPAAFMFLRIREA